MVGWEAGQISPVHSHPTADEIYHVLEGEGLFNDGTQQQTLKPGDTVILAAGESHQVSAITRMVVYRVHAVPDHHAEMAKDWPAR